VLELAGFPADVAFHPHGLFYHRPTSKLYVVNHAYARGGERVEVFRVRVEGGGQGQGPGGAKRVSPPAVGRVS
jgi:hypothetical protein